MIQWHGGVFYYHTMLIFVRECFILTESSNSREINDIVRKRKSQDLGVWVNVLRLDLCYV